MAAGDLLFGFRIELTKAKIWFERLRRRLELGRHHPAWPAPLGPEIDQQWQLGIRMPVKISRCKRDGPALKERPAAASASSCGTLLVELHCGQATVGILYPFVDEPGSAAE